MMITIINSLIPVTFLVAGFYFGYKIRGNSNEDKLPDIKSPMTIVKEHKEKVQAAKEEEEVKAWINEIDNYSGEFGE